MEEQVIDPDIVLAQPELWRCIGAKINEQLDYEPARFLCRRRIRRKYVSRRDPEVAPVIAPLSILQDRCLAAPGLLAQIIVSKYCDHLQLYRQEQIFQTRHGVTITRQAMAWWLAMAAEWVRRPCREIETGVTSGGYVQTDETPVRYRAPGNSKTTQGYLAMHRPAGDTVFHWHTGRAAACLQRTVPEGWRGILQCDGYTANYAYAQKCQGAVTLASCMAHIRRGLHDAGEETPTRAGWMLRQIAHLYRLEKMLCERRAGPGLRKVRPHAVVATILTRPKKAQLLCKSGGRHLPQSAMGKALSYALGQWDALAPYLADGRVEIDNNLTENAIRPQAIHGAPPGFRLTLSERSCRSRC